MKNQTTKVNAPIRVIDKRTITVNVTVKQTQSEETVEVDKSATDASQHTTEVHAHSQSGAEDDETGSDHDEIEVPSTVVDDAGDRGTGHVEEVQVPQERQSLTERERRALDAPDGDAAYEPVDIDALVEYIVAKARDEQQDFALTDEDAAAIKEVLVG